MHNLMSKNPKSTEELLSEISRKLDILIGVLAIQSISNIDDKIYTLKKSGFTSDEIGPLVGFKGTTVRDRKGWKQK